MTEPLRVSHVLEESGVRVNLVMTEDSPHSKVTLPPMHPYLATSNRKAASKAIDLIQKTMLPICMMGQCLLVLTKKLKCEKEMVSCFLFDPSREGRWHRGPCC